MIDKGPDSANPLALVGTGVLGAIGAWFLSQFVRKSDPPPDVDDEGACAKKSELRTMRSDFKGDIAYVVGRLDELGERMDGINGQLSRIRTRQPGQPTQGD